MEHKNLLFYLTESELRTEHPNDKVTRVRPGVAFSRQNRVVLFNKKRTQYTVTVNYQNRSGSTLTASTSALTNETFEKHSVKVSLYPLEISNYKPLKEAEKLEISADTEYTFLYLGQTAYTVTVHHVFAGSALTADTTVLSQQVFEDEFADVEIVPLEIEGYSAGTTTIRISGNTEYTIEYSELPDYPYVDMGLPSGTLWGEYNIGATSPEEYGNYYAWGEVEPKTSYVLENYAWYDADTQQYTKYSEIGDELEMADDAAAVNIGGDFHMPTVAQSVELLNNSTTSITEYNGVTGLLLTSSNNGNTLFFPGSKMVGENMSDVTNEAGITSALTWTLSSEQVDNQRSARIFDIYQSSPEQYSVLKHYGAPVRGVIGTINNTQTEG